MKAKVSLITTVFFVCCIAISYFCVNAHSGDQSNKQTITGTVIAIEWDEDDNVRAVAIEVALPTEDPENEIEVIDYLVADNAKGNELLKLEDETVEATGVVEADEDGSLIIYVEKYKIINE